MVNMEQSPVNNRLVPIAIVIAGGLIALAIYLGGGDSLPKEQEALPIETGTAKVFPVTDKDHIVGSRNAPVIVIEYSDTECPFCKVFHQTMRQIVSDYEGQVAWVYRHFPIAQLHSRAIKEAEATECAAELGGNQTFWQFTNKLFETTNSNNSLDPGQLPQIAESVGLDVSLFNDCLSSGKYTEFIEESVKEAVASGARGTPYSIIVNKNGETSVINGSEPISSVKGKIDLLLK